jgi:F-type H+-transporting ATPase subunit epsilon
MSNLTIDLLTPSGTIVKNFSGDEVKVPLLGGEVGILTGHENLVGQLGSGIVEVKTAAKVYRFFVSHGICKVEDNRVLLLSTTSEPEDKIDLDRAKNALKLAQTKLSNADQLSPEELIKYQRKLDRAQARIQLAYIRQ